MNKRLPIGLAICTLLIGLSPMFTDGGLTSATSKHIEAPARTKRPTVPGRVIVKFRENAVTTDADQLLGLHSRQSPRRLSVPRMQVIDIPEGMDAEDYAALLKQMPDVEFAEPDYLVAPAAMTLNDPLYDSEWHLAAINAQAAWDVTTGDPQITIAVCDSGIDATQPDLADQLVPGWNVVDDNNDTSPVTPHGTEVAGTAAAAGNNSVGVAAPAMHCRLMPMRITSRGDGLAASSDILAATIWAVDHGARVINLSYGGFGLGAISEAAEYAHSRNCIFVMAAGNDGAYVPNSKDPNIFAVSATMPDDSLAWFTTTGPYVDLAAPGSNIITTSLQSTYAPANGTSFSAPLVASTAALILSVNPQLTATQVETLLKVSADDLGPAGYDPGYGFGRLNAGRALELAATTLTHAKDVTPPAVRFLTPAPDGLIGRTTGELVQIDAVDDYQVAKIALYADDVLVGQTTSAPYTFLWNTANMADGSAHILRVVATDKTGNTSSLEFPATIMDGYDVTPPVVQILSPANGTQIKPPTKRGVSDINVRIAVSASDNSGDIFRVELYVDGVLVTDTDNPPYTILWTATDIAPGPHTLVCWAYDRSFNIGRSNTVTVVR